MSNASHRPPDFAVLSPWAPELAHTFVSLASDIALVIDSDGVIRSVSQGGANPIVPDASAWVGRRWIDTVSEDARAKVANLLLEVSATGIARRREVHHRLLDDERVPIAYTAIRLGADGPVLVAGCDLRASPAILPQAGPQHDMERAYWQARQAESRYRLMFQVAADAVLVVDGDTLQIVEANEAAATLWNLSAEQLTGRPVGSGFEHFSRDAVHQLLGSTRSSGRSGEIRVRLLGSALSTSLVATPLPGGTAGHLLVRLRPLADRTGTAALNQSFSRLVDTASDGIVVTDTSGRILMANPAFLGLVGIEAGTDIEGRAVTTWLSPSDQPIAALMAKVRRDGLARSVESRVRRAGGPDTPIRVSATLMNDGDQECIGFTIRPATGAAPAEALVDVPDGSLVRALHVGIETLANELGSLGLAETVRQMTALAEAHFVQLALQRSGNDLQGAAAILGVSADRLTRRVPRPRADPGPGAAAG